MKYTLDNGLLGLTAVCMVVALYLVFGYVPTEQTMGIVQRIFYFHVPSAWVAFMAFFVVMVGSVGYLRTRDKRWDQLANASAQLGVLFTTLVLITGPLWARPAWGVWWTWDARLTTTLVLWLIYVAYLMVRAYSSDVNQTPRFAAVIGIVGFIDVPIVFLSITLWRTQHPGPLVFQSGGLAPSMLFTLLFCVFTFTLLYSLLLHRRLKLFKLQDEVEEIKASIEE